MIDGFRDVIDQQREIGAAAQENAAVGHLAPVPVKAAALFADLFADHGQLALPLSDGLDLRIDLRNRAERSHALKILRVAELEIRDAVTVDQPPIFVAAAALIEIQYLCDRRVSLRVEGKTEAVLVRRTQFPGDSVPVDGDRAEAVRTAVCLFESALHLADRTVGHAVIA